MQGLYGSWKIPPESKKARCLVDRNTKTRPLISKIGIICDLQWTNLDFDP